MKRISILASGTAFALLALVVGQGCSSEDDPDQGVGQLGAAGAGTGPAAGAGGTGAGGSPGAGTAGTGAVATGGSEGNPPVTVPPAGGAGGAATGAATGGTGGAPAAAGAGGGATAGAGGGGAALAACVEASPGDDDPCAVTCTDLCGVKNLGSRVCTCTASIFDCGTCTFSANHPLLEPNTEPFPPCALPDMDQENDESGCTDNDRCESITDPADRFCGCLGGTWDCDGKLPSFI